MQPISAPTFEDIATRTRRKWGEVGVVNQRLLWPPVDLRKCRLRAVALDRRAPSLRVSFLNKTVAPNHQSGPIIELDKGFLLTVQRGSRSVGAKTYEDFAMIGTVTAVLGLVSAGIFLAHAFEGIRSRA
jgi:hypothetical protein